MRALSWPVAAGNALDRDIQTKKPTSPFRSLFVVEPIMSKKWYNFLISVDQEDSSNKAAAGSGEPKRPVRTAAQTVAEIASSVAAEPTFTTPVTTRTPSTISTLQP